MANLKDLIRYESASSGILFRKAIYGPGDDAEIVADVLGLANADLGGNPRFIFVGAFDTQDGQRRASGVNKQEMADFKRRLVDLVAATVEPQLNVTVRAVDVQERLIGVIRLDDCDQAPYLTKVAVGNEIGAGVGFVRRGARTVPLTRSDLLKMLRDDDETDSSAVDDSMLGQMESGRTSRTVRLPDSPIIVGFPGPELPDRIELPALGVRKLPSQLAAERLRALLEAKQQSRDIFGKTQTHISRLVHARHFGTDIPYEEQSDDSLLQGLDSVEQDYRGADEHYLYEVRAHKINLMILNRTGQNLNDVRLRLMLPRVPGAGVADRVYTETENELPAQDYPKVTENQRATVIDASFETVYRDYRTPVFREPIRLWARENAAGRTILVNYELSAEELPNRLTGSLMIVLTAPSLRSV